MFKQALEKIVERTAGAVGALIMGTDGISVEKVILPEGRNSNLDVVAAEFTSLLRSAQKAGSDTGAGSVRELIVSLDEFTVVMRLFTKDYFMVLAVSPDGNLGRGRYELRKAELDLASEFAL
jgi:predicted regulator of Ras-like GTPase activity (Roadblock/LC7/MglB family)